eukprot:5320953-Pyramimonas_sp.AAC.2
MAKTGGKPAAGKENGKKPNMDENAIKTDVAEFAAQLGLAAGGSGFDDRDFRNPPKPKQPKAKVRCDKVSALLRETCCWMCPRSRPCLNPFE